MRCSPRLVVCSSPPLPSSAAESPLPVAVPTVRLPCARTGLACDEDNQPEMSEDRVKAWIAQIKGEGMPL